jgi:hypothetical protein
MKTFLIFAGIGLVCLLLMIRFFFSEFNSNDKEREWFVQNLRYEFSIAVDSVQRHYRTLVDGRVTAGEPKFYREDSLKNSLKKHGNLRFVTHYRNDSIRFTLEEFTEEIRVGDSIHVSSKENSMAGFRTGKQVFTKKLSGVLYGWGKPPFRTQ